MEDKASGHEPAVDTYYEVLGVSPDASQDRVHRAFSALLAEFRADPTPEHEERVRRGRVAYKVLSDPQSRALYNAGLKLPEPPRRKWERYYLQDEEEALTFWTGAALLSVVGLWGFFREYVLLKGLLWLPRLAYRGLNAVLVRKRPSGEAREQ